MHWAHSSNQSRNSCTCTFVIHNADARVIISQTFKPALSFVEHPHITGIAGIEGIAGITGIAGIAGITGIAGIAGAIQMQQGQARKEVEGSKCILKLAVLLFARVLWIAAALGGLLGWANH